MISADGPAFGIRDPEAFARNLARIIEEAGKAASAYLKPREGGQGAARFRRRASPTSSSTLAKVAEYWLAEPERTLEAQNRLLAGYIGLWTTSLQRMMGEPAMPVRRARRRRQALRRPRLVEQPVLRLPQAVLPRHQPLGRRDGRRTPPDLDPHTRQKAAFYVQQIANALAPSNFVLTNPEVLRETLVVERRQPRARHADAGRGHPAPAAASSGSASPTRRSFKLGENIATTPGKVVHQNELCQLIQYAADDEEGAEAPAPHRAAVDQQVLHPRPQPGEILHPLVRRAGPHGLRHLVGQPGRSARRRRASRTTCAKAILESLDVDREAHRREGVNAVGYCVGGTLLSVALAYMAATGDKRIKSATLFATQVDFTNAGDLKVFVDEEQIAAVEKQMSVRGYLEGRNMAAAFNMLRSNDLIWPYVIGNYFKGKEPPPFDLLYWNSDTTRMPAANHAFYLRNCYLDNTPRRRRDGDRRRSSSTSKKVKMPIYNLATREDHIAPPRSVFYGSSFFGGKVTFVLTGSGHIAGVINPPARNKYQYWTGPAPKGDRYDEWLAKAKEHPGSWWPHWQEWIEAIDKAKVKARARRQGASKTRPAATFRVKA